jgi:hypothetical protein
MKESLLEGFFREKRGKRGQATHIAPLQLHTLAVFRPWGSSVGADRIRLARSKGKLIFGFLPTE